MHDPTKVLMGTTQSSDREITTEASDPANFPAGRAVRKANTGALSLASGDGSLIGVSLGKSLSDIKKTAVVRVGNWVPLEIAAYLVKAQLTFISKVNKPIKIEFLDTGSQGAEEATVTDEGDNWLISLSMESTASTTTQCKAALDSDAADLIETQIASGQSSTAVTAFAEDDIDSYYATIGAGVRVSNVTGKGIPTSGTLTGACYLTGKLTGIQEDLSEIPVALIDMGGGL